MLTTILECVDLDAELRFFRSLPEFEVHLVSPADDPQKVVLHVAGHAAVELRRSLADRPVSLAVSSTASEHGELVSPGGSAVTLMPAGGEQDQTLGEAMSVPANNPTLVVVEPADGEFGIGRAGMEYRDLLPGRWGGRFIASHIRIEEGGDVEDWVHFHRIRFQMIYVAAGWVDVVYEDQGEPFRMVAGDCVLQPPEIRHRVLRSSPGLEVIEIGCPAEHDTLADHALELPNQRLDQGRDFSGQRFVRHVAADAGRVPWVDETWVARDTGIGDATSGLAGVVVVSAEARRAEEPSTLTHNGEIVLVVALSGDAHLDIDGESTVFAAGTSVAIPAGTRWAWSSRSDDHAAMVVSMPSNAVETA